MTLCKKDTRSTFDIITTQCDSLERELAEELHRVIVENVQNGRSSIVQLSGIGKVDSSVKNLIEHTLEISLNADMSLVWCDTSPQVANALQEMNFDNDFVYAPTLKEAIDIVSMEDVMRDMMRESDENT